jgi:4a-hydroxytetrahydrobiopterin dehydratase
MNEEKHSLPTFSDSEIVERLQTELPNWYLEKGWIRRKVRTGGWKATLMVANTVAHLAEKAWHHPDMSLSYAFVIVKLTTHSAKGITEKDFRLAHKIEEVVFWDPSFSDQNVLEGTPNDPRFTYIKKDEGHKHD